MSRTPHRLLHLVEADHPAMPPPEGDAVADQRERGGDLSSLACAAMLDADDASVHAVVVLGPPPAMRRAAVLGADPVARAPVPFGTPHATANALRKVIRHCGVRFDACIAWSAFAARVARLTGFGPARGDFAPLLEADPHRPDPEVARLELLRGQGENSDALQALADRAMRAAIAPAALPTGQDTFSAGQPIRIALLADPAPSGSASLAWRGAVLTAAASSTVELRLPAGCAGIRRVGRLPDAGRLELAIDADPLPQRLARAQAALAIYGPEPHQHASPGLVAYALSMGLPVVAHWERLRDGHPSLHKDTPGLHLVHASVPIEIARAMLGAFESQPLAVGSSAL
ncbi:MAG: hypothetical protein ACIAQU_09665 [Phycisphaerales bacterium JB064]